jgi:hypothetical protein
LSQRGVYAFIAFVLLEVFSLENGVQGGYKHTQIDMQL